MNQLQHETSPYLLQHAGNPVHWHAWNDEALARAVREDKPILVSIGYATCHWCHVMERESFEDEATAQLMNAHFVCIKVDREERPDVDRIYMEACQAINGSGGWPLNAFLLPDGRPFYAGTYYPPTAKFNRPSWRDVLLSLSKSFTEKRAEVVAQAERLTQSIASAGQNMLQLEPEAEDHDGWRQSMLQSLRDRYDHRHGGFGGAPKFPMSQALEALLAHGIIHAAPADVELVRHGVLSMLDGGIYDQLGGGFSRYTVDSAWRIPHFEKMLYDNALLLRLIAKLHMTRPDERFVTAIHETTTWLNREMLLPDGGYRAALDADSEGIEGKYYVWQLEEIEGLLPADDAAIVAAFYGITETGNWAEEHTNIPHRPRTLEAVAADLNLPGDVVQAKLKSARDILHDYRFRNRIHPGEDDKMILQWNALLVSAWSWCYRATSDTTYLNLATDLQQSIDHKLYSKCQWHRNITNGSLGQPAFLDDLAALSEALLDLYEVTFDRNYLFAGDAGSQPARPRAREIAQDVLNRFSHHPGPMFDLAPADSDQLPVAAVDLFDNALPSGNSQMMRSLLRLGRLLEIEAFTSRAEEMLAAMAGSLQRYPTSFGGWLHAALLHAAGERELVVVGPGARTAATELLSDYRPGLLLVASDIPEHSIPLFENRYLPDGLRFYLCENRSCQLPVSSLTAVREQLGQA